MKNLHYFPPTPVVKYGAKNMVNQHLFLDENNFTLCQASGHCLYVFILYELQACQSGRHYITQENFQISFLNFIADIIILDMA